MAEINVFPDKKHNIQGAVLNIQNLEYGGIYMTKNELIPKDDLMNYFKNISELENRKITYDKAISEVEQEIENAGIWYGKQEPTFSCIDYEKYNDKHSARFVLFWIISSPICIAVLWLLHLFIWKIFNINVDLPFPVVAIGGIIVGVIVAIRLQTMLYNKMYYKKEDEYHDSCQQIQDYNNKQREEAEKRSENLRFEKKLNLIDWQSINNQIEERLQYLYDMRIIPEKYQNAVAISFFVSYLESGRCDTLKECMNKYDDDAMYYQLKGKLEDIYQRIGEMEGRLSREIKYLKKNFELDLQDIQILVDNNSSQIDRISYNQRTNELLSAALLIDN